MAITQKWAMRISLLFLLLVLFFSCRTSVESTNPIKSETYISAFHEGVRLKLLGNYEEAVARFKKCLKEKPEDDASHFAIAQISLIKGDLEQAKYHTIQAATFDKSNLYYQIELGYMYRETGEHEKSALVFEEILAKRSTNSNYYFESALSWELSGNIKKAISVLNRLEENMGIQVEASLKKHVWFKGLMKIKEAEHELLKVLEIENNNQYVIATLVDFYLNSGQIELGMLQLNKLVELDPKNGTGLILLAQFEFERKNIEKCKGLYSKAILSESLMAEEVTEQEELNLGAEEIKDAPEEKAPDEQAAGEESGGQEESKTLLSDDGGDGSGEEDSDKAGEVPEKYEYKAPEGIDLSEDAQKMLEAFDSHAKDMGLTQDQYQAVIDYDIERGKAAVEYQATAFNERIDAWGEEVKADKELGGESLQQNLGLAKKVLDGYGSEGFQRMLDKPSAENPDGLGLGNHPEMIRFLNRVGKSVGESDFIDGDGHKAQDQDGLQRMYPSMAQFN